MCIWEGGAPAPLPPLFSQEFCHPTEEYNGNNADLWHKCIFMKSATECPAPCVFTDGSEMIPPVDFCAPREMSTDLAVIKQCAYAKD
jgi:hypothetical protein